MKSLEKQLVIQFKDDNLNFSLDDIEGKKPIRIPSYAELQQSSLEEKNESAPDKLKRQILLFLKEHTSTIQLYGIRKEKLYSDSAIEAAQSLLNKEFNGHAILIKAKELSQGDNPIYLEISFNGERIYPRSDAHPKQHAA